MALSAEVIGLDDVGLPSAAILPSHGDKVLCVDVSDKDEDAVNRGEASFVEPDLATHVAGGVSQGMLLAQKGTPKVDTYIGAVPMPFAERYKAYPNYIDAPTDWIIPHLKDDELVRLAHTSAPGATRQPADRITAAHLWLTTAAEGDLSKSMSPPAPSATFLGGS